MLSPSWSRRSSRARTPRMARALYIHWPFCLSKCPYCDFNSHVRDSVDAACGSAALLADMAREAEVAGGEPLTSIFFGGGTPSLMPPALVEALLAEAQRLWGFAQGIEITLEGNPTSVEAANYAALAAAGVNRVSLGLQALDDQTLQFLGRQHSAEEGLRALDVAQDNFARVNFDLIYARPGQSLAALGGRTRPRAGARHRASVALPADHRARHALCHAGARGQVHPAGRGCQRRHVRPHPHHDRRSGPAGLRSQQPRPPRRGEPAQPCLLALSGHLRRRPRRACEGWRRGHGAPPQA